VSDSIAAAATLPGVVRHRERRGDVEQHIDLLRVDDAIEAEDEQLCLGGEVGEPHPIGAVANGRAASPRAT
jgi:hypothetical protein